jgi:hypothetical protein
MRILTSVLFTLILLSTNAQDILPPLLPWNGTSQQYMVAKDHKSATPFEKSEGLRSASEEELNSWIQGMSSNSNFHYSEYGKSPQERPIRVIKISTDNDFLSGKSQSTKPVILIQAGIHAGEIDGMDAGMMISRDLCQGKLRKLLDKVNVVFIPVINPDGHARLSMNNRINQRGPVEMGWRSNSLNQNLNRDYTKLDTRELQALMKLVNEVNPDLYFDIHVTDGADYQYDITYGFVAEHAYSPKTSEWLKSVYSPNINSALTEKGHIPGPLVFAKNGDDFKDGNMDLSFSPRFSHSWGDAHHTPSILVENHSLKPFKQRVLGTYVFLEATLKLMAEKGLELRKAKIEDEKLRPDPVITSWKFPETTNDSMLFKGIKYHLDSSMLTGIKYTKWEGTKLDEKIPVWTSNVVDKSISRPKEYVIPVQYSEIIEKLKLHGIEFQKIEKAETLQVNMYHLSDVEIQGKMPFQGRMRIIAKTEIIQKKEIFPKGSIRISTDQARGTLAVLLLEPSSTDSYFQWGFFAGVTERTEYFETYAMVPLSELMANSSPALRKEYIEKIKSDENFAKNEHAKLRWWFEKSEFNDDRFMLYPIGLIP